MAKLTRCGTDEDDSITIILPSSFVRFTPPPPPMLPPPGQVSLQDLVAQDGAEAKARNALRFLVPCKFGAGSADVPTVEETVRVQHEQSAAAAAAELARTKKTPHRRKVSPGGDDDDGDEQAGARLRDVRECQVRIDQSAYSKHCEEFGVGEVVRIIFSSAEDDVEEIEKSLTAPFTDENESEIAWTLVRQPRIIGDGSAGAMLSNRTYARGLPWSIVTLVDEVYDDDWVVRYLPRQNLIYDGDGLVRACCDFGHQSNPSLHIHPLVPGSLEHSSSDSVTHCLPYSACPWIFCAVFGGGSVDVAHMPRVRENDEGEFEWVRVTMAYDRVLCDDGGEYA